MAFGSKSSLDRHNQYSYTHAQKVREYEFEYQSPETKRDNEVVVLVQNFLTKAKIKRTAVIKSCPKSLTQIERNSPHALKLKLIKNLARSRWVWAISTVMRTSQVNKMKIMWDKIDGKKRAKEGYSRPFLYFTGSRLFVQKDERMFIDVSLYLHSTVTVSTCSLSVQGGKVKGHENKIENKNGKEKEKERYQNVLEVVSSNMR